MGCTISKTCWCVVEFAGRPVTIRVGNSPTISRDGGVVLSMHDSRHSAECEMYRLRHDRRYREVRERARQRQAERDIRRQVEADIAARYAEHRRALKAERTREVLALEPGKAIRRRSDGAQR